MSRITRRRFVQSSLAAGVALGTTFTPWQRVRGANDLIRCAVAGVKSRGGTHIDGLMRASGATVVGLCDVDRKELGNAAGRLEQKSKTKLMTAVDLRELLDSKDIDAVSIATPNHWHSLQAIWSMQAGKDVYVEKPVSHNVWEGRQVVNAARKYGKICQTGTQSRTSLKGIGEAVAWVQEGNLGKIQYALGTCYKPRQSIGKLDKPLVIPSDLDYDLWCGPAEKVDLYRPKLHYDWHWDFNTGNGDMGNQGIHQMDIARWFLGEKRLSPRFMSIGGRLGYDDAGNTPNTQTVLHDYDKAPLIFETRGLPKEGLDWKKGMDSWRGSGVGVIVQCEGGHVLIPNYYSSKAYDKDGKEVKSWRDTDPTSKHFQNFVDAVRSRNHTDLNADIEEGHISSGLCHTGNIAHRVGAAASAGEIRDQIKSKAIYLESFERMREHLGRNGVDIDKAAVTLGPVVEMDPQTERITNNDKAAKLLSRDYRKPYIVPDLSDVKPS